MPRQIAKRTAETPEERATRQDQLTDLALADEVALQKQREEQAAEAAAGPLPGAKAIAPSQDFAASSTALAAQPASSTALTTDWTPPIPLPGDPADNPHWIQRRTHGVYNERTDEYDQHFSGWGDTADPNNAAPPMIPSNVPAETRGVLKRIRDDAIRAAGLTPDDQGRIFGQLDKMQADYLDDLIFRLRVEGVPMREIAKRIGGGITEETIALRFQAVITRMDQISQTEHKVLLVARLEYVINSFSDSVARGDIEAADVYLKAIERLAKIVGLEKERVEVEVKVVTQAQAIVITDIVDLIIGRMRPLLDRSKAPEIIEGIIEEALEDAGRALQSAEKTQYVNTKTGELTR